MDLFQENRKSLTLRASKRLALLKEAFQEPGNDVKEKVPRHTWALLLVCEMKFVERYIEHCKDNGHETGSCRAQDILEMWISPEEPSTANIQDCSVDEESVTTESDSVDDLGSTIIAQVRERDADKCVITSHSTSMLCDICPDWLLRSPSHRFWLDLRSWYDTHTVDRWKRRLFPSLYNPEPVETIQNYISLSPILRKYWEWGNFVLRPHPKRRHYYKKEPKVQIFWLPSHGCYRNDKICIFKKPGQIRKGTTVKLVGFESEELKDLKSGDWITLTTPDPVKLPLPSWDLLELRFIMTLFARFAGKIVPEDGSNQGK